MIKNIPAARSEANDVIATARTFIFPEVVGVDVELLELDLVVVEVLLTVLELPVESVSDDLSEDVSVSLSDEVSVSDDLSEEVSESLSEAVSLSDEVSVDVLSVSDEKPSCSFFEIVKARSG